ncbi:T9SS type A sorting domain-containing protein [Flavobacterium pallidum]|uniref:Secretion system C-terminal sorting domain-containing protein n=1 Tax=Flavobacterium pallidum TaxID=2172098 RepID=A0A2S1SE96_9FLAO|nr:T9SS type A sorting domain-containing protein [Flavobacterium pallidum]AWI24694.1 hypothetical protein HYN49_01625 [Flavobacterium pallidum]
MKTTLLSLFSLITAAASAQSVASYYGDNNTAYTLFSAVVPLDHSATGANQTWNFSGLTATGNVVDVVGAPTGPEATTYPGTTGTSTTSGTENGSPTTSKIFSKDVAGAISVTGVASDGLILNYSADNASVGTYPLAFGYSNSDSVAGTFTYTTYSGTFSGNVTTTVDAYGTLTLDPGPDNMNVVRIKTTQTIDLFYPPFGDVGDVIITSYSYYEAGSNSPLFRTATTTMVVALLSINQTRTRVEIMSSALGLDDMNRNTVQLLPNPAQDVLHVVSDGNQTVRLIRLIDMNGRIVSQSSASSMNVSQLQKGMYFAEITTDSGTFTKKVIKQ